MRPVVFALSVLWVGCSVESSGLAGGVLDGSVESDGSLSCPAGLVDLNNDVSDGCECVVQMEECDGEDDDCDGSLDEDVTLECGMGVGACEPGVMRCDGGDWGVCEGGVDAQAEVCEGAVDEDCDGAVDNGCSCTGSETRPCGEAMGACERGTQSCVGGVWGGCEGGVTPTDETCNDADDDCDGEADEGLDVTFYRDEDGDGFGNPAMTEVGCAASPGFVAQAGDCNDACPACNPDETEVCDTTDQDCDGNIDEGTQVTFHTDGDDDGYGDPTTLTIGCSIGTGFVADGTDCDDTDPARNPGVTETCDGVDNDCDGVADGDEASLCPAGNGCFTDTLGRSACTHAVPCTAEPCCSTIGCPDGFLCDHVDYTGQACPPGCDGPAGINSCDRCHACLMR